MKDNPYRICHTFDKNSLLPGFQYYCKILKPDGTSEVVHKTVYTTSKFDFNLLIKRWNNTNKAQWRKGLNFYYYYT